VFDIASSMATSVRKKKPRGSWDAKRIRALRIRFGETQEHFAGRLGVTFTSVSRWEGGHSRPSPLAVRLLDKLDED
jgi:DNA-binding transcriptional regulator YiaG